VFRWGGDEFILLMTCTETEARRKGTKLKKAFASSVRRWSLAPGVGLSVGCAELGRSADDIKSLIQQADERMYADKKSRAATRRDRAARGRRRPAGRSVARDSEQTR
jgi:diguanylate cyclase (GGDEF)-like protein